MAILTLEELKEIITALKTALKRAGENGGVTDYTIKSSQGETRVKQASLTEISEQLTYYIALYNEQLDIVSGSTFTYATGLGL